MTVVAAALLAAGASARFGDAPKLMASLRGRPLVCYAMDALVDWGGQPSLAVCRPGDAGLRGMLAAHDFELLANPRHEEGVGTSIACAARRARELGVDGLMICLGDMPYVSAETLDALCAAFAPEKGRSIVVAKDSKRSGAPVIFAKDYFGALCALQGDEGGRSIIKANPDAVYEVTCTDESELDDVDTPEALAEAERRLG